MANGLSLSTIYGGTLAPIDKVRLLLASEIDVPKVADFAKRVEAAKSIDSKNGERRNYWGELAIWSTRRLGELIRDGQNNGSLANKTDNLRHSSKSHDVTSISLADIGIEKMQSARAQKLADVSPEKIETYVAEQKETGDEVSKAGLIRFATGTEKAGTAAHVSQNTGVTEWYTPDKYLDAARKTLGSIDLDPASSKTAQKRVKAKKFYTIDDDGLSKKWRGRVFMNPPYSSDLVGKFVTKLCESYQSADVSAAILLVNNATETSWFQLACTSASGGCFPKGRIKFIDESGDASGAPLQGQAFLYFGSACEAFEDAFSNFGFGWWTI